MLEFVRTFDMIYMAKQPHEQKVSLAETILRMWVLNSYSGFIVSVDRNKNEDNRITQKMEIT